MIQCHCQPVSFAVVVLSYVLWPLYLSIAVLAFRVFCCCCSAAVAVIHYFIFGMHTLNMYILYTSIDRLYTNTFWIFIYSKSVFRNIQNNTIGVVEFFRHCMRQATGSDVPLSVGSTNVAMIMSKMDLSCKYAIKRMFATLFRDAITSNRTSLHLAPAPIEIRKKCSSRKCIDS